LENVSDIAALHTSVAKFFSMVFGGPAEYKGRNMYDAHKHMPLTKKDYDGVWRHMEMSYKKHGVSDEIIKEVKEVVYSFYD
jgi:truncated hemoglobin YjbI